MAYKPDDSWKKSGQSTVWDYQADGVGAEFFGVYKYTETEVGTNNSNMYKFERFTDDKFQESLGEYGIWGNSLLDIRFKNFERGELVFIEYKGKEKSEKRKGAEYHNFEIYHKLAPFKKVDKNGMDEIDTSEVEGFDKRF